MRTSRIVVADPSAELLRLVRRGDVPRPVDRRAAQLLRRRFGISLPPPFVEVPTRDAPPPVRLATAADAVAIAAVKWRAFGTNYRGVLPDAFLDHREVVPPTSFWVGRAMIPPSRQHSLSVWGGPGELFGYLDAGPGHDDDLAPGTVGEVYELYVDPLAQGRGGGARLLADAVDRLGAAGLADLRLWTLAANTSAQAFYRAQGWELDGARRVEDLGSVVVDEVRFRRR